MILQTMPAVIPIQMTTSRSPSTCIGSLAPPKMTFKSHASSLGTDSEPFDFSLASAGVHVDRSDGGCGSRWSRDSCVGGVLPQFAGHVDGGFDAGVGTTRRHFHPG